MNFIKFMLILLNLYVNLYGCVYVEKEKGRKRKSRGLTVVGLSHLPKSTINLTFHLSISHS